MAGPDAIFSYSYNVLGAPCVDAVAFRRIERDWHTHVERMRDDGNNAITVPLLLELIVSIA